MSTSPPSKPPTDGTPDREEGFDDEELADIREADRFGDALWGVFGKVVQQPDEEAPVPPADEQQ